MSILDIEDCPFCFLQSKTLPDLPETLQVSGYEKLNQRLIYKGNTYNVKPDISPITINHFLIIPHNHFFSFLSLPKDDLNELELIKDKIKNFYKSKMGMNYLFFEHGSCKDSKGSSCIHHAHIHSIPINMEEEKNIILQSLSKLGMPIKNIDDLDKNNYLYLESSSSYPMFWNDKINTSQLFRIIISDILGVYKRSKWQNCILDTIERLKSESWLNESGLIDL